MYPNYAWFPAAGSEGVVTLPVSDGSAHPLTVVAHDSDGHETVLGRRVVSDG